MNTLTLSPARREQDQTNPEPAPEATSGHTRTPAEAESGVPERAAAALPVPAGENLFARFLKAVTGPLVTFGVVLLVWSYVSGQVAPDIPGPGATLDRAKEILGDPFYQYGPNDMGIGWQVLYSLGRVLSGFLLAVLVGVPTGFAIGSSAALRSAVSPLIQVLRPVSPLAWLPIGLLLFRAVDPSAVFVIFITSIWPVILNTAAGVEAVPSDYRNVARVLSLSRMEYARKVLLPACRPHILTGMRLSLSIAWMVIVAAEMLTGGIGIGFYVWDEWNNLNVASILVAIGIIGCVGIALEAVMNVVQKRFDYERT